MSEATDTEAPADPITGAKRSDLVQYALATEAFGEAFADYGQQLGAELRRRMVKELEEEGTRPTWEAKGIGKIVLNVPEAKLAVRGAEEAEFTSWAAQNYPDQIVATIEVPTKDLENVLTLLEEQGYEADCRTTLTARGAWLKNWLEGTVEETVAWPECKEGAGCKVKDPATTDGRFVCETHQSTPVYVDTKLGMPVPGIFRKPAADPHIARRLDAPKKTAVREAVADFLADRLAKGIPAGTNPLALLAGPVPEVDANPAPESDGQPEVESLVCTCSHTAQGQHRKGPKQYGKCLVTDCPCRRFTERTPE